MNRALYPWLAAALAVVLSGIVLFAVSMTMPLNHDEQQFIAAGALVGREGLLPYRDFAYFHTPNLPFLFACVFQFSDHLLLVGRSFSVGLIWLAAVALFFAAYGILSGWKGQPRVLLSAAAALAFICNPLTVYSSWKAWNHALPIFLFVLALICSAVAFSRKRVIWFALAGVFVSLAAGTRISYAPLALPFLLLAAFSFEGTVVQRLGRVVVCGLGMFVGILPSILVIAQAPQAFLFDNFLYNGAVNSTFRAVVEQRNSIWPAKLLFALRMLVQPANLILVATLCWLVFRFRAARLPMPWLMRSALLILPFALLGTLAASPSYSQYYSPLVPLLILAVLGGMTGLPVVWQKWSSYGLAVAALVAVVSSVGYLGRLGSLASPSVWTPMLLHQEGLAMRPHVPAGGRVLTLAPILPLEGGFRIYPQMASGPFGWRTAPFMSASDKARFHLGGLAEVPEWVKAQPPAGIYIGYERKYEDDLADFAKDNRYRKISLGKKKALWLPRALR